MGGDIRFDSKRRNPWSFVYALVCLTAIAGGCSKSEPDKTAEADKKSEVKADTGNKKVAADPKAEADDGALDTSKLPRVAGAKQVFASPASTIFTSPESVQQTADALGNALAAAGWQSYVAPNTARSIDPNMRLMSLKKGRQALSVFVNVAPAQNNATSVQYAVVPLKTDLPFAKDATDIAFDPNRPLLIFVTAESAEDTLAFYRKELGIRGWALWSGKLGAKQPDGGPSGIVHRNGAFAYYVNDQAPAVALVLTRQNAGNGKSKIELKELPIAVLKTGIAQSAAKKADVRTLPRLEGAKTDDARLSADKVVYSVAGSVADTAAATRKLLAAAGWTQYVSPSDERETSLLFFKKGPQGLTVSFTRPAAKDSDTSVYYDAAWIYVNVPVPDGAADVVYDDRRPYFSSVAPGTVDAMLDFYDKQLGAEGWVPLTAAEALVHWPNAKLDGQAYYIRDKQKPIVVSAQSHDGGKVSVEVRVASFAQPQVLEADKDIFGMPVPKPHKTAGGTGGDSNRESHALVMAEVDAVLAFYRRELAARNWKEEAQGAVLNPQEVALKFSSAEGTAVLKLGHKYDLTSVSLVQRLTPKAAPRAEQPSKAGSGAGMAQLDDTMKEMQRMLQDATTDMPADTNRPAPKTPQAPLGRRADGKTPVPVPDNAEEVEFDAADGKLEFSSASAPQAIADFYRTAMKEQGWNSRPTVINNANMVVLNFAKAGKAAAITIMKMGDKTNVSAEGPGLMTAAAAAAKAKVQASADDLIAEDSGGLPLPKRHTMSTGTKTPFRRELQATVPLELGDVLGFYRRELGKVNWKEEAKGASVKDDSAVIAFTAPDGPAVLKLGRKDDATSVELVVKNPEAARKSGVLPKPGQARVLIGNINPAETAITFNNKTYKVAAGAGTKAPDGPMLDLPPGKYRYSVRLPGRPSQSDEVELGADETWGLMIGPGGVLPLQAY